ncbi:hydroquinone glucosyltransferase-like [Andrographis paniculata]|uniref:hydroquinone glucosyltransferase-like n=1 Tax=Andrographis paniculata TaxID=175694 RepID=UPI0021E79452|nr:hydroquinone glucosyltransferase-like [Andrographis paniculata]
MKPHLVFLPTSGMGHIIPLFQLAKKLVLRHGCHVTFLVITTEASAAQENFFRTPAANVPGLAVVNLPPADVSEILTGDMRLVTQISVIARESLKPLKSILTELGEIAGVIIDIFATDAIDVCREMSIPVYSFFTASAVLLAFTLCIPTLDGEVAGEYVDLPAPIEIPGCRPMRTVDLLDQVRDRKNAEYEWYLHHSRRLSEASGIFLNVWEDLDSDRIKALNENPFFRNLPVPPVYPVGPVIKDGEDLSGKDAGIIAWLDSQPPESVLFVCLGSGGALSSKQLIELAWGLELSRQRFVLVARRPTDGVASAAYFTVGGEDGGDPSSYLPAGFVDRTEGRGLVVPSWSPQMAILRHGSTGAFLSHCGWNSTLESLVHGVPMVAWPLYAEQRMNATMLVEEAGVAARVSAASAAVGGEVVGREEIARVVKAVIEGEEGKAMRRRAQELKETARAAAEDGGASDRWLAGVLGFCVEDNK